jgi:hypothetical protein
MATYTVTAASVVGGGNGTPVTAGETIVPGDIVYTDESTNRAMKADKSTAATAKVSGIALNLAYAGQPLAIHKGGVELTVGSIFSVIGRILVLSGTAGRAMDVGDLTTSDYVTIIGWTTAADKMWFSPAATGLAQA